jgi:predicted permease
MSNFVLLGFCLLAGVFLRAWNRLPKETPAVLNQFIFHISLPALVIAQVRGISPSMDAFRIASVIWGLFLLSSFTFYLLGRFWNWDRKTWGALILTAGLGNTSFIGFPMLEALYGPSVIKMAIFADQMGSFLVLSSLGIVIASYCSAKSLSTKKVVRRILTFPPIYALGLGLLLHFVSLPYWVDDVLVRLGGTLTPLALVSTGFQFKLNTKVLKKHASALTQGLFFKLVFAPWVLVLVYQRLFHWSGEGFRVAILEAAMAPMITAAVIAAEYELNTELANLMVGVGIPLSFITIPIWAHFLV